MSLGIVIKGPDGIVLAADSRVTLLMQQQAPGAQVMVLPATFDNATKLLKLSKQDHVGAVTYGLGAMLTPLGPRTMHSFLPEFEADLTRQDPAGGRLSVTEFAARLSNFYLGRWNALVNRPPNPGEEIFFLVGGYDDGGTYGRVFAFSVPSDPTPVEKNAGPGDFGISWGGQTELVERLISGFDPEVPSFAAQTFGMDQQQAQQLRLAMALKFQAMVPYQFLPLQDCVDLAVFLVQGTIAFQKYRITVRGVGGQVDVATITGQGFNWISQKTIAVV